MTSLVGIAWGGPRRIGALAGLASALVAVVFLVVLGASPSREAILWLAGITVWAVVAGWLVGPLAKGTVPADLMALGAYALVVSFGYLLVGAVGSVWTDPAATDASSLAALGARITSQLLYGLLFLPLWATFVAPFALAWSIALRVLRRRARLAPPDLQPSAASGRAGRLGAVRPRRLAFLAAAIILGYGLIVAVLPLVLYNDPRPPWWIDRPIALFSLFAVPAVVAAVGALRGIRPLLAAAGVLCFLQAYIAFSGVTIGFVVPGAVLLWAAGAGSTVEAPRRRISFFAGIMVVALTVAAWVSLFSQTEPRCWTGEQAADGTINMVEVPATDSTLHGPAEVPSGGGGCSSAEFTVQGMGLSAALAIGAIAVAAAATSGGRKPMPPER